MPTFLIFPNRTTLILFPLRQPHLFTILLSVLYLPVSILILIITRHLLDSRIQNPPFPRCSRLRRSFNSSSPPSPLGTHTSPKPRNAPVFRLSLQEKDPFPPAHKLDFNKAESTHRAICHKGTAADCFPSQLERTVKQYFIE